MADACGAISFLEGGTITSATIINSQISNSVITNSDFQGGTISALNSIDPASALTIANAIADLPVSQLRTLAEAIAAALAIKTALAPETSDTANLPYVLYGGRNAACGDPDSWEDRGEFVSPLYKK